MSVDRHPELVDPPWLQAVVRRAYEVCLRELMGSGVGRDEAWALSLWRALEVREDPDLLIAQIEAFGED